MDILNHSFIAGEKRKIHTDLDQGSEAWDQFRLTHYGASEAAAMLGISRKQPRNELLYAKKTMTAKQFSTYVQEKVLDKGHKVEELARPITEAEIGGALYTDTYSLGLLSYSSDGVTTDGIIAWEHKQWNDEYAALVIQNKVPEEHMPQCQQGLLVSGADRLLFTISDGTETNRVSTWVYPDPEYQARIIAGWAQFHKDKDAFEVVEKAAPVIAEPVECLPAVLVSVTGSVAIQDNLNDFRVLLNRFIEHIDLNPIDDQGFANLDAAAKELRRVETALKNAKDNVRNQISSVGLTTTALDQMQELARTTAITAEKAVKEGKETRKKAIINAGLTSLGAFRNSLKHRALLPEILPAFSTVTKNLRSLDSYSNAVDTEVARVKIEYTKIHDIVIANIAIVDADPTHAFLFNDRAALVLRDSEFVALSVKNRIADYKAAVAKREEEARARIRAEEEARAKSEAEQKAEAERQRIRAEEAAKLAAEVKAAETAQTVAETIPEVPWPIPVSPRVQTPIPQIAIEDTGARMTLGQINTRLGVVTVTKDSLSHLGIESCGREKNAVLYRESDFPRICRAIAEHMAGLIEVKKAA